MRENRFLNSCSPWSSQSNIQSVNEIDQGNTRLIVPVTLRSGLNGALSEGDAKDNHAECKLENTEYTIRDVPETFKNLKMIVCNKKIYILPTTTCVK